MAVLRSPHSSAHAWSTQAPVCWPDLDASSHCCQLLSLRPLRPLPAAGEYVFDSSWAQFSENRGVPYYPKLQVGESEGVRGWGGAQGEEREM